MIGGDRRVFESGKPYFECMGKQFCRCDGPGLGLHAKLTNNMIIFNIMQAFTEGLFLNTKAGVDPDLVLSIFYNSAARNRWIAFKTLCFQQLILHQHLSCGLQGRWPGAGLGKKTRSSITLDQFDPADVSSGCRHGARRGTFLL
jgi:3-hydroxyisobutyrate dehydrogenase-like beta-hydroxyacid dehydrogenase